MNSKTLTSVIVAIIIIVGIVLLVNKGGDTTTENITATSTPSTAATSTNTVSGTVTQPVVTGTVTVKPTVTATPTSTPTGPLSITLVSPNGGEIMRIGEKKTITFITTGPIKNEYRVALVLEPGFIPLATITATTTSFAWTVPSTVCLGGDACTATEPGAYSITARLYDNVPCVGFCMPTDAKLISEDKSNSSFIITK